MLSDLMAGRIRAFEDIDDTDSKAALKVIELTCGNRFRSLTSKTASTRSKERVVMGEVKPDNHSDISTYQP